MSGPSSEPCSIRVILPYHLRTLAKTGEEVVLAVSSPVTAAREALAALETSAVTGAVAERRAPRFMEFHWSIAAPEIIPAQMVEAFN